MSQLTPERSSFLSFLLDEVVGTEEIIKIRRDFCRISDRMLLIGSPAQCHCYYTGSRAEGLDLPGSDNDVMQDINDTMFCNVVQTLEDVTETFPYGLYVMCTDKVPPAFSLLRRVKFGINPFLFMASQDIEGHTYLSSNLLMNIFESSQVQYSVNSRYPTVNLKVSRQGPALEGWTQFKDQSESGNDLVYSIRCKFWPTGAQEWIDRPRYFGWPTTKDISSIVSFGCHLVPVGHPKSTRNMVEWRISFSIAERMLVWSFNHVQMQCYAVMKIILKEFIKLNCRPENFVLCSYFIKTFLFWKFETTESHFWRPSNFVECIRYLLVEFSHCVRVGVLSHYFFPKFNLLSVKLTQEAQAELLNIIDLGISFDIGIFKECKTLRNVWATFLSSDGNEINLERRFERNYVLQTDECMMEKVEHHMRVALSLEWTESSTSQVYETPLLYLALKCFKFHRLFQSIRCVSNKDMYRIHRIAHDDELSFDISTCKLWYATFLLRRGYYASALTTVNQVLSSIPPYALYYSGGAIYARREMKNMYIDMFLNSNVATEEKLRTSWLFDLHLSKKNNDIMPFAIQIELYFSECIHGVQISPFTFSYYLKFMCFHGLSQHEDRKRALRQLIDVVNNPQQSGIVRHHSYNVAGYCLLMAGQTNQARDMFNKSYQFTAQHLKQLAKYNSASWYLANLC